MIYNVVLNIPNTTLMVSFTKSFPGLLINYFSHLDSGAKPVSFVLQAIDVAQYLLSLNRCGTKYDQHELEKSIQSLGCKEFLSSLMNDKNPQV